MTPLLICILPNKVFRCTRVAVGRNNTVGASLRLVGSGGGGDRGGEGREKEEGGRRKREGGGGSRRREGGGKCSGVGCLFSLSLLLRHA